MHNFNSACWKPDFELCSWRKIC